MIDTTRRTSSWQPAIPDMDDDQYAAWSRLMTSRLGVVLSAEHKSFFMAGLRGRMREIGCDDYQAYLELLSKGGGSAPEWSILIDRLTVHETRFFRDPQALELLRERILPEYMKHPRRGGFQAWSVGCATGEEAYSLAMCIDTVFCEGEIGYRYGVTATDISSPALEVARRGEYHARRWAGIPEACRERYCRLRDDGSFHISEELRRRIGFSRLNIFELEGFPLDDFDLIYCQNVFIYFRREDRQGLLDRMADRLTPGGVMILGAGDILGWSHPDMQRIKYEGTLAYQRRGNPEARD